MNNKNKIEMYMHKLLKLSKEHLNPVVKFILLIEVSILVITLKSFCYLLTLGFFFFLVSMIFVNKKYIFYILIFCSALLLLNLLQNSNGNFTQNVFLPLKLFNFFLVFLLFGVIFDPSDIIVVGEKFYFPYPFILIMYVVIISFPMAMLSIRRVSLAQKARGFKIGCRTIFEIGSLKAFLIPYIISYLKDILYLWVTINLRPLDYCKNSPEENTKIKLWEYMVVAFIFLIILYNIFIV